MSEKTIISLGIIGAVVGIISYTINQATEVFKDHTDIAWFILGFGCCLVLEAIIWGIVQFFRRRYS